MSKGVRRIAVARIETFARGRSLNRVGRGHLPNSADAVGTEPSVRLNSYRRPHSRRNNSTSRPSLDRHREWQMALDPRKVSIIEVAGITVIILSTALVVGALYALWATS